MNTGVELEKNVLKVYSFLLNMKNEGIVVARNVQLTDKISSK